MSVLVANSIEFIWEVVIDVRAFHYTISIKFNFDCVRSLQELVGRSTLETQKLELMTEVSSLKLKLTAVERDRRETEVLWHSLLKHACGGSPFSQEL